MDVLNARRKLAALVLAVAMVCTLLSCYTTLGATATAETSDTGFYKYEPGITLTAARKSRSVIKFIDGESYEDNAFSQFLEQHTGISIKYDWIVEESQYQNKINLSIASSQIPDCFVVEEASQVQQLIDAGLIMDITDVFDEHADALMKEIVYSNPDTAKLAMNNGRLYGIPMMPSVDFQTNVLCMRKDWLDNLGLQPPTTAEELWNVMDAFVNRDPDGNGLNDTLGISFNKDLTNSVGNGDIGPMFYMYGSYPWSWEDDGNGGLVNGATLPETKVALANLADLYQRGLIDQEFAVKDPTAVSQDIVAGKLGMEFGVFWSSATSFQDLKNADPSMEMVNLDIPSVDGNPVKSNIILSPMKRMVISSKCENPEAVIEMVALAEEIWWGNSELTTKWTEYANQDKYSPINGVNGMNNYPIMFMEPSRLNYNLCIQDTLAVDANDPTVASILYAQGEAAQILDYLNNGNMSFWGTYMMRYGASSSCGISNMRQDNNYLHYSLFSGTSGTVGTEIGSTLNDMQVEAFTKIIMGQEPVDYFDTFVSQWIAAGGDRLTAEVSQWYRESNF